MIRLWTLIVIGASQLAVAQFTNTTFPVGRPKPTPFLELRDGLPMRVGDFKLYGCANSTAGFPDFVKVASNAEMSLDLCAASCPSRYFGVYSTDCYCGEALEDTLPNTVTQSLCNKPCPGNAGVDCGGQAQAIGGQVQARSAPSVYLSMYERANAKDGVMGTLVLTLTKIAMDPIPSCDPTAANCMNGANMTGIAANTKKYCNVEWFWKKIVCYGEYCATEVPCETCKKYRVVCEAENCRTVECGKDEDNSKLVVCKGGNCEQAKCEGEQCKTKVVCWDGKCSKQKCYGDECNKKLVCQEDKCKHEGCKGGDCHKKIVCKQGHCIEDKGCKGNKCVVVVKKPVGGQKDCHKGCHKAQGTGTRGSDASRIVNITRPLATGTTLPVIAGSGRTALAFNLLGLAAAALFLL